MTWQMPRESEYTPPRDACPHPEYWEVENIMATERTVSELVAAFVRACQPEMVLEIGSHYGQTTALIAQAIKDNGHGQAVSLELDADLANVARARCGDLPIEIVTVNSLEYVPDQMIDFLFVDGQLDRLADLEHFIPYLTERALIILHDMAHEVYAPQIPRMIELLGERYISLDSPRGLLIFKR
jgi:predicted O-methyltransferase YrrM